MAKTVSTGWRSITPGECVECGSDDCWDCDGRGAVLCSCQACPYCGMLSAEGFHEQDCPATLSDEDAAAALAEDAAFRSS